MIATAGQPDDVLRALELSIDSDSSHCRSGRRLNASRTAASASKEENESVFIPAGGICLRNEPIQVLHNDSLLLKEARFFLNGVFVAASAASVVVRPERIGSDATMQEARR